MTRMISAHEVGEFAYCSRAWWLVHVHGLPSSGGLAERREGLVAHGRHARRLAISRLAWRLGLALALSAIALAAVDRAVR